MFDQLGKINELRKMKSQADAMKKEMEKIEVTVTRGDYEIVMRGDQTVVSIKKDGEDMDELVKLYNKASKESQKKVAKKMRSQLSGMNLPF